jgi:hypothetical protein
LPTWWSASSPSWSASLWSALADEVQIQQRIDEFAATVPESARPQPEGLGPLRGAGLAWTGGALIAVGLLGAFLASRRG